MIYCSLLILLEPTVPYIQYNPRVDNSVSETRYIGKICEKHPEEGGLRFKKTCGCVGCHKDKQKKYRQTPEMREKLAAAARERRLNDRVAREHEKQVDEKIRLRAVHIAIKAKQMEKWKEFRQQALDELRAEGVIPK